MYAKELKAVVSAASKSDFGSIDVFGESQLTYKGWALHYFGQDTQRGETNAIKLRGSLYQFYFYP